MLDNLLSSHEIDYIKWDANRPISQTNLKKDLWYKHIQALYDIVKETKKKHPDVLFEACASGGGRIDYGILGIFDDSGRAIIQTHMTVCLFRMHILTFTRSRQCVPG